MAEAFHYQVRKLIIPANKQDAYVYKAGTKGLKRDTSKQHEGVWNAEPRVASQAALKKNPAKVWVFFYDHLGNTDIQDGLLDNNPNQGEFGYTCKYASKAKLPEEMVFFLPKTKLPKGYTPGGVWLHPEHKLENLKELGDGATGFMDMGDKLDKGNKYGVGGGWKMLGMNEKVVTKKKEAELRGRQTKTPFEIKVRTHKGEIFPLEIPSNSKIQKVKEKINAKRGIPIEEQRLFFDKDSMKDNKTLKESGVKNGDILDLGPMKVYVKNPKGKRFLFEVEPDEKIEDIMDMVEAKEGTPADQQILSFLRLKLAPEKTLTNYRIKHMNVIDLSVGPPSKKTRVFVEVPESLDFDDPNGNKIEMAVGPTQTFGDIKQILEDKCGVPKSRQRIFFQDGEVDDDTPVAKKRLKEGDTLRMEPLPPEIQVKTPDGKSRTFFIIDPEESVNDFKERNKTYLPPGSRLIFNDEELVDEEPLGKYKLKNGDVLLSEPEEEMYIETPVGKVNLVLSPTMTPSDIKDVIEEKTGVPKARQRLFYMDEELEDDKPIGRPKVLPGQGFEMVSLPANEEPPEVQIKTPDGKVRAFFMDPEELVKDFRQRNKKYFPPGGRLIFNDEELVDEEPLGKYKLKNGDILLSEPEEEMYIETPVGKVNLVLLPTMTPSDIKDVIEEKTGVPKARQRLFYLDNELDDKVPLRLQKTKLAPGAMLAMRDIEFEDDPDEISPERVNKRTGALTTELEEIEIMLPDRSKVLLSVLPTMTVSDLKKVVEEKIPEMKSNKQRLFFFDNNEDINDETPIKKLNLSVGKPLEVRPYEITIKQRNGEAFHLNPDPMEYIDDVKDRIEELKGMPADRLRVSFNGKMVDDTLSLEAQGIHHGSVLVLEPMKIYVDVPNGKQLTFQVAFDESIKVIKKNVAKEAGYAVETQCILLGAGELEDSTTLVEANIDDEDVLKMETFQLQFVHWLGYHFDVPDLAPGFTVPTMKNVIEEEKLILKEDQSFEFEGKVLNDTETLKEQGVKHKALLFMQEGKKIDISLPKKKKVSLTIFPTTTLSDVKKVIEEKIPGMTSKKQRFFLFDKEDELDDETPLAKLDFDTGKPLELRLFEIIIKHWNGDTVILNPDPSEYIDDVKDKIEELMKIPADGQRITRDGKMVDDAITLENQGIEHGCILSIEQMRILVAVPDGKQLRLRAELTDKVNIIKKKIAKKTGYDSKHQSILFAGEELEDKMTLAASKVNHGDVLIMEIYQINIVDSSDGNAFPLVDVARSDTGDTVRQLIKKTQGIDVSSGHLFFREQPIKGRSSLKDQGIKHKAILAIRSPDDAYDLPQSDRISFSVLQKKNFRDIEDELIMPVEPDWRSRTFIFDSNETFDDGNISITVMHWSGKTYVFDDVRLKERIKDIKKRIRKPKKTSTYRLILSGKALNDKKKLLDQGVRHKSILIMEEIETKTLEDLPQIDKINFGAGLGAVLLGDLATDKIRINIKHWNEKIFSLDLGATEYADDIRDAIFELKNIPVDHQHLAFDGNLVDDTLNLKEQDITNGATLSLVQMKICVELPTKATMSLKVELDDTISKVKKRIAKTSSYEAHTQCLLYRGEMLEDTKTVLDYNIHDSDHLTLERFQVTILRLKGDNFAVSDIHGRSRISDLQDIIERKKNVPAIEQQLRFHGKILDQSRTLASQGIFHKSILVLETLESKSDAPSRDKVFLSRETTLRRTKSTDGDNLVQSPSSGEKQKIKRAKSFDASGVSAKPELRGRKPESKKPSEEKKKGKRFKSVDASEASGRARETEKKKGKRSKSVDASEASGRDRETEMKKPKEKKKGKRSKSIDATKLGKLVGRISIDKGTAVEEKKGKRSKSADPAATERGEDPTERRGRRPKKAGLRKAK